MVSPTVSRKLATEALRKLTALILGVCLTAAKNASRLSGSMRNWAMFTCADSPRKRLRARASMMTGASM